MFGVRIHQKFMEYLALQKIKLRKNGSMHVEVAINILFTKHVKRQRFSSVSLYFLIGLDRTRTCCSRVEISV